MRLGAGFETDSLLMGELALRNQEYLKITGGVVYDPANGTDGDVVDIWMSGGKVVAAPNEAALQQATVRTLIASGMIVMPGGVDMHCHIAGPKVNAARMLRPESSRNSPPLERTATTRSGVMGSVPSTFATGYRYAGLGYTTAFDAAVPPLVARHAHLEFADTPCIDKGFFALVGNNHFIMESIERSEPEMLQAYLGWLLGAVKGYAPKLVNPGGVEMWKQQASGNVEGLDDTVRHFNVTPRQIITGIAQAANDLKLPHPLHVHCNQLGVPGNASTTLETMKTLEGRRGHLTHIQFHSYLGDPDDTLTMASGVGDLANYVNNHENVTVDVGQVMFGDTVSMTGDGPLGYFLQKVSGEKWISSDTECEAGCGISPITYRDKNMVNALQWAIGLEWFLQVDDPWRVAMSTDHPNGGSFLAYPQIIQLLMDADFRRETMSSLPAETARRCSLADIDREYSLNEIAIITRAGPARILGLPHKGHLGIGADADVTIYSKDNDLRRMFELPRYVIKAGKVIVEDGEIRDAGFGDTLFVRPEYDPGIEPKLRSWFAEKSSVQFSNYGVADDLVPQRREVSCDDAS